MANGIKGMSRSELLELLVAQMEENERLKEQLNKAEQALQERVIRTERAGSIAEAALALNDVFRAAEAAAKQYQESVETAARERAAEIMAEAEQYSQTTKMAADLYWKQVVWKNAMEEAAELLNDAAEEDGAAAVPESEEAPEET